MGIHLLHLKKKIKKYDVYLYDDVWIASMLSIYKKHFSLKKKFHLHSESQ
jgi:hypothetical protein